MDQEIPMKSREEIERLINDPVHYHASMIHVFNTSEGIEISRYDWRAICQRYHIEMYPLLSDHVIDALAHVQEENPASPPEPIDIPNRVYVTYGPYVELLLILHHFNDQQIEGLLTAMNETVQEEHIPFRDLEPWVDYHGAPRALITRHFEELPEMTPPLAEVVWPIMWVFQDRELVAYRPISPMQLAILLVKYSRENKRSYTRFRKDFIDRFVPRSPRSSDSSNSSKV
ncbi:hypothetical protein [Paenibacillus dendritiformis]|uniref:hypothetical protein n=1 Tax=Paenibacillus dendritiformis TaxID=130049 RepID=UPI000DA9676C|nr:hypothetical protein [Paenibacillus dendritiformis]PZM64831.1 hypothetical protein DOE73_14830 [Paenibacillus dendritiformis]